MNRLMVLHMSDGTESSPLKRLERLSCISDSWNCLCEKDKAKITLCS